MNTPPLNVGIIGCGFIAQSIHIPSLVKCKGAKLVAVCDKNEELAKNVAKTFNINKHYSDVSEMLSSETLDIVDVCTSIDTHAPLSIQAMEASCHVLVEKPIALTTEQATEMIQTSIKNNVKLCVVHDMLFGLAMMKIKSMVNKGIVGNLVGVEVKQSFPPQDFPIIADETHWWHKLPGGVFGDALPHPIYLAREFLGELEPIMVHTRKLGHLEHMPFDEVEIILEGQSGAATIISSCNWPSLMMIDIFGTKMNIHGDLYSSIVTTYKARSNMGKVVPTERAMANIIQSTQILTSTMSTTLQVIFGKQGGHRSLINKFINSIRSGWEPPVTMENGKQTLRLLEKITSQMI
ncbi:MAG TPA: Gfo/Idh/MocA family oxidoreductase [Dehalococcoidia bacterium]|nr:Gfo/Idh/MocA family oxidoreductase [Dehalococcoidia bacterium]